jgi:hypothetical protein
MTMKKRGRLFPGVLIAAGTVFVLHFVGIRVMDHYRVVEVLMSARSHASWLQLAAAAGFMAVRLAAMVVAPAAVLAAVANFILRIYRSA